MFVANGQKFILLPATCLHQVLPHTPQHHSYRFFMVFNQTSDFNMFHRDLRDAWTTMCCQDLGPTTGRTFASMTFLTSCNLAQSLYALRLTSTWWGIQKIFKAWKNITLGKKIFTPCVLCMFFGFLWYLQRFGTGTFRQYGFAWHWAWKALIRMFRFHFGRIS